MRAAAESESNRATNGSEHNYHTRFAIRCKTERAISFRCILRSHLSTYTRITAPIVHLLKSFVVVDAIGNNAVCIDLIVFFQPICVEW